MANRQQSFQSSEQFRVPAPSRSHQFIFNKLLSISIATRALQSCQCCPSKFYMQNLSFFPTLSLNFHKNLWYWSRAKIHISSAGMGEVKNLLQNCEILPWEKMAPFSWIHCEWNLLIGPEKWHHFETMLFFFCKKNHSLPPQKKNPCISYLRQNDEVWCNHGLFHVDGMNIFLDPSISPVQYKAVHCGLLVESHLIKL